MWIFFKYAENNVHITLNTTYNNVGCEQIFIEIKNIGILRYNKMFL